MNNKLSELIETMIELLGEDEVHSILKTVIYDKSKQFNELQRLSSELPSNITEVDVFTSEELVDDTANGAVLRILREATKPMSNSEIRNRYFQLFKKDIRSSSIGNALWKGKKENLFEKVGSEKGTRYTKWRICTSR